MGTQQPMFAQPSHAAIGELLERLTVWCDERRTLTFVVERTSTTQYRKGGGRDEARGYALAIRRRGALVHTLTAGSLAELARVGGQWLDEQR